MVLVLVFFDPHDGLRSREVRAREGGAGIGVCALSGRLLTHVFVVVVVVVLQCLLDLNLS